MLSAFLCDFIWSKDHQPIENYGIPHLNLEHTTSYIRQDRFLHVLIVTTKLAA